MIAWPRMCAKRTGNHSRVYGGFKSHTLEELVEFWRVWTECDRLTEHTVTWADVKANIVVKEFPATSGSCKIL